MIDLCSLRRIQTALKHFEDTLKAETGLSLNDAMCLCSIHKGLHEPGQLAKELELSSSRLSRILDALEGHSYVTRRLSEGDRRNITVLLTDEGNRLVETYRNADLTLPDELAFTQNRTGGNA